MPTKRCLSALASLVSLLFAVGIAAPAQEQQPAGVLSARWHPAGFDAGDDSYNAVIQASDGKIYYVICAHKIDLGGQMFSYDPSTGQVRRLGDLTEVSGEKGLRAVPQGKSHVPFFEHAGKLYFATHLGYYNTEGGKEMAGVPPAGYKPYPGGHFLSYDLATGAFERLADAPSGEGIITMTMDTRRGRLYGLTWPSAHFLTFDLSTRTLKDWGKVSAEGEKGTGSTFRVVCRAFALNPLTGSVYFTVSEGDILHYDFARNTLKKLDGCSMKRPVFGKWDPDKPGHMGYNWRQIVWSPTDKRFYGVHGNSGYLFSFDPLSEQISVLDRIASEKTRTSGLYDAFSYGYLSLTLGPDRRTLYFLTGTPAGEEVRFVTYHIPTRHYVDHGALAFDDGSRPNWAQSIEVGSDKRIYAVSKIRNAGKLRVDLLSFPDPLRTSPPPAPVYKMIESWTSDPRMPNPLKEAHAACFDKDGNIIVVDSVASRVQRFTPKGRWLGEIGQGPGNGPGHLRSPRDAKVSRTGEIYVADAGNGQIKVFRPDGNFLRSFGRKGSGPGEFLRPHALDIGPNGQVYVVDPDNNRVSVFDPSGKLLFEFGKKGTGTGEFRDAHGLGIAANGDVYVSNFYGPVQKFTADGKFIFEFAPYGFRGWTFFHSMGVDVAGNVYLAARNADRTSNAIVMYDHRGAYVTTWKVQAAEGDQGTKSAVIDPSGLVYVCVEGHTYHGISVYKKD